MATKHQTNTAIAAYAFGVALALVRLTGARTVQDLVLIFGFTLAEFSVVEALRRKAEKLDADAQAWHAKQIEGGQRFDLLRSAQEEDQRRYGARQRTIAEVERIEQASEEDHLLGDLKALTAIATSAVRGGYAAGIARDEGDLGGVQREVSL